MCRWGHRRRGRQRFVERVEIFREIANTLTFDFRKRRPRAVCRIANGVRFGRVILAGRKELMQLAREVDNRIEPLLSAPLSAAPRPVDSLLRD